jgi:hypothetical protein
MKRSDLDTAAVLRLLGEWRDTDAPGRATVYVADHMPGDVPPKVVTAKLYQLCDQGLVDYGVAVEYCFLTREGRQFVADPAGSSAGER